MTEQDTQIMRYSISHYGEKAQITKAIEELAELIVALAKRDFENTLEEIADVSIMLDQLCLILNYDPEPIRQEKLERLKERMGMPDA